MADGIEGIDDEPTYCFLSQATNRNQRATLAIGTHMGRAVRGDRGNIRRAILYDVGASRPGIDLVPPRPTRHNGEWNAVRAALAAGTATDMFTALRKLNSYRNRRLDVEIMKVHATVMFLGPEAGSNLDGMRDDPLGEGMPGATARDFLTQPAFRQAVRVALGHHFGNANHLAALPNRFKLRMDFLYSTAEGDAYSPVPKAQPKQAFVNEVLQDVPRFWPYGHAIHWYTVTPATLPVCVEDRVDAFFHDMDNVMPQQTSNRVLRNVIAVYLFAFPTNDAGQGGNLYGARVPRSKAAYVPAELPLDDGSTETALVPLPRELHASAGIALCDGVAPDGACIAASLMLGLDSVLATRSDSDLLVMLNDAVDGMRDRMASIAARRAFADPGDKEGFIARLRVQLEHLLETRVNVQAMYKAMGRHLLPEGGSRKGELYTHRSAISRAKRAYAAACCPLAAGRGHPLVDLSDPFFRVPQALDDETLRRLNAAAKPLFSDSTLPSFVVQAWTVGINNKIGLHIRHPLATLQYLLKGGRVVNLLFAHNHVSCVVDVGRCCSVTGTEFSARIYCGLCGFYACRTNPGAKLLVYQHQLNGCPRLTGVRMTAPLSNANRHGLNRFSIRARNLPLLMGFLDVSAVESDPPVAALRLVAPVPKKATQKDRSCVAYMGFSAGKLFGDTVMWGNIHECFHFSKAASREAYALGKTDKDGVTLATPQRLLESLCHPSTVDGILQRLAFVGPVILENAAALPADPAGVPCYFCRLPCGEPSLFKRFAAPAAAAADPLIEEGEETDDAGPVDFDEEDSGSVEGECVPVKHHCHATGLVAWAHGDCNTAGYQSSSALTIEVGSVEAMARCARVLCSSAFMDSFLGGKPPTITTFAGDITRIVFRVSATPRKLSKKELAAHLAASPGMPIKTAMELTMPRALVVTLRPATAFPVSDVCERPPSDSDTAADRIERLERNVLTYCRSVFNRFRLWPLFFGTNISFSRALLFDLARYALPPAVCPTSLVTKETLAVAKRMLTGGRLVMGDAVRMQLTEEEQASRRTAIMLLDFSAAYPAQLQKWKLPLHEHAFTSRGSFAQSPLAEAVKFITECDLNGPFCTLLEISGAFPPELQRQYARFPPVYSKVVLTGADLSCFQRVSLGIDMRKVIGPKSVAHFYPLVREVVFVRTAKILRRLGFAFTEIGRVWTIPQAKWGAPFADAMEKMRAEAPDAAASANVKLMANAVLGSLAVDKAQYGSLSAVRRFPDRSHEERAKSLIDNPRFTLRKTQAGDVDFYEMAPARWLHDQSTFAFIFIQAMARDDLVELVWGDGESDGLCTRFPSIQIGYGATDSLSFKVSIEPDSMYERMGFTDVRQCVAHSLARRFDTSNIPPTSSFFDLPSADMPARSMFEAALCTMALNKKRFGMLKEATGGAGCTDLFVNGPNRWAYAVLQHPRDTAPEFQRAPDVLKGIPKAWTSDAVPLEDRPTVPDFAASFYNAALPDVSALPALPGRKKADSKSLDKTTETRVKRNALSIWCNTACIVEADEPFRHFPIGSTWPEALAAKDKPFFIDEDATRTSPAAAAAAAAGVKRRREEPEPEPELDMDPLEAGGVSESKGSN